jgi:hypothetical protein
MLGKINWNKAGKVSNTWWVDRHRERDGVAGLQRAKESAQAKRKPGKARFRLGTKQRTAKQWIKMRAANSRSWRGGNLLAICCTLTRSRRKAGRRELVQQGTKRAGLDRRTKEQSRRSAARCYSEAAWRWDQQMQRRLGHTRLCMQAGIGAIQIRGRLAATRVDAVRWCAWELSRKPRQRSGAGRGWWWCCCDARKPRRGWVDYWSSPVKEK